MKYLRILTLAASLIILNTANANGSIGHILPDYNLTNLNSDPIIFTIISYTNHAYWAFVTDQNFSGSSITEPCSDMTEAYGGDGYSIVMNYTDTITSQWLINSIGPARTCFRSERTIAGPNNLKVSTGNIKLIWDENSKTYIGATPDKVSLDFRAGDQ
jgi:hypothetical protein